MHKVSALKMTQANPSRRPARETVRGGSSRKLTFLLATVVAAMGIGFTGRAEPNPDAIAALVNTPEQKEAAAIFDRLMNDPVARAFFNNLQRDVLPTPVDSAFRNFFASEPLLAGLYQAFDASQDELLKPFINKARSGMIRARKGMGSELTKAIYEMVVELARDLGFPPQAIENVEIYISSGPKNAFTVSGSVNRIVIVLQSDLIETMTLAEMRAIIGHELGHIVLGHTTVGRMNMLMLSLLEDAFIKQSAPEIPGAQDGSPGSYLSGYGSISDWLHAQFGHVTCVGGCALNDGEAPSASRSPKAAARKAAEPPPSVLQRQAMLRLQLGFSPEARLARNEILVRFLDICLRTMEEFLAPREQIDFVESLRHDLVNMNAGKYVRSAPAPEFMESMVHLLYAVSRSREVSADRISASVTKNEQLASAFIKILGLDRFDVKERSVLIRGIVEQANGMIADNSRAELTEDIGTTHPSPILRILLMTQLPSYPAFLFAFPFLRVVTLTQSLAIEDKLSDYVLKQVRERRPSKEAQVAAEHKNEIATALAKVQSELIGLLSKRDFASPDHTLLADFIHSALIQREQLLEQRLQLGDLLAHANADASANPAAVQFLKVRLKILDSVTLTAMEDTIKKVSALAGTSTDPLSRERLAALQLAIDGKDLERVRNARLALIDAAAGKSGEESLWPRDLRAALEAPVFIVPRAEPDPEEDSNAAAGGAERGAKSERASSVAAGQATVLRALAQAGFAPFPAEKDSRVNPAARSSRFLCEALMGEEARGTARL